MENPVRKIQYGELSTEYLLTQSAWAHTPPRSPSRSNPRYSGGDTGSEDGNRRRRSRRTSFAVDVGLGKKLPTKQHRKERIVVVDSPPAPQTPPQSYRQTFTPPASPNPPFIIEGSPRGRPIIVDERPRGSVSGRPSNSASNSNNDGARKNDDPITASATAPRSSSVEAVLGERVPLRRSRSRPEFESPSSSHTSFDSRARREAEEVEERRREERRLEEQERQQQAAEAARRRAERIAAQDEEIRRRPAVPMPPKPLRQREFLRPVVNQSMVLEGSVDGMRQEDRLEAGVAERRRREDWEAREERERFIRLGMEAEQEEAQRRRLRERQLPGRRFSVGPVHRRHRVLYDDGVYRWE